jgi:hypothetical protein
VVTEALPERTTKAKYDSLVKRIYGKRFVEYFDKCGLKNTLGADDTHGVLDATPPASQPEPGNV